MTLAANPVVLGDRKSTREEPEITTGEQREPAWKSPLLARIWESLDRPCVSLAPSEQRAPSQG